WETWNPWPAIVDVFEAALAVQGAAHPLPRVREPVLTASQQFAATPLSRQSTFHLPGRILTWHDAIRSLELDDAARRSGERRRASTLEYQEATEEAGFKGP